MGRQTGLIALICFLGASGLVGYRAVQHLNVPGEPFLEQNWALADFRDIVYYPVKSFLQGQNPYNREVHSQRYPVNLSFPLHNPSTLLIHLPFGLLPYEIAEAVYFLMMVMLIPCFVYLALKMASIAPSPSKVFGIAAFLVLSRPGYWNLVIGQSTLIVAGGTYLALFFARTRPWLSGLGVALAMIKPTFGLPLGLLLLMNRDLRAFFAGAALSAISTLAAVIPLCIAAGGLRGFLQTLVETHIYWSTQPVVAAASNMFRIDTTAFLSRVFDVSLDGGLQYAISFGILGLVGAAIIALRRSFPESGCAGRLSSILICLAIVASFYHQAYDLLLLVFPAIAFITGNWTLPYIKNKLLRWMLAGLVILSGMNHLRAEPIAILFGLEGRSLLAVEAFNGFVVFTVLGMCIVVALLAARRRRAPDKGNTE